MSDARLETIAEELTMLRKLALFAILNSGVSQGQVAAALGVNQATVSRMMASGAPKKGSRRKSD